MSDLTAEDVIRQHYGWERLVISQPMDALSVQFKEDFRLCVRVQQDLCLAHAGKLSRDGPEGKVSRLTSLSTIFIS